MNRVLIISLCFFIYACGEPESSIAHSEIVSITTPDGVEIRSGEISEVMASDEAKNKFLAYLENNDIYYRLDDRYPNEVSWVPESEMHQKEIIRKAFEIPVNQIQKLFKNEENYKKYQSILQEYNIEHIARPYEEYFVVIWTPHSKKIEADVSENFEK
jgi:hypothetical protein